MIGLEKQLLGCLVRDIQTGASIGWVKSIVFDPQGERITELLVDPSAKPRVGGLDDRGENLLGRPLFDSGSRYLGEIIDVVVGAETGRLQGFMIERTPGEQDFLPAYQGMMWEDGHWTLMEENPRLRSTMFPAENEPALTVDEPSEDWMVGRTATVRLTDRRGQLIVDRGQRITAATVESASRAGVLHMLEAEF